MSIGKAISHEQSIAENLNQATFEVGSGFEQMSIEAVDFLDKLTPVKSVVDLGCGDGAGVKQFVKLGYEVTGVDINQTKLDRIEGAKTVCNDFLGYLTALPDGSVDNIFCHHALEHYPFYDQVLREVARVLKYKGYCLIVVPAGGQFRGPHHAVFSSVHAILPPGMEPVYQEPRLRQENEFWCLSRKV